MPKEPKKEYKVNEIIDNLIDKKGDGAIQKRCCMIGFHSTKSILAIASITPTVTIVVVSQYYFNTIAVSKMIVKQ